MDVPLSMDTSVNDDSCNICGESLVSGIHVQQCLANMAADKVKPCSKCGEYFKIRKGGYIKHERACKGVSKKRQTRPSKLCGLPKGQGVGTIPRIVTRRRTLVMEGEHAITKDYPLG
jgi:hypothetical protein